MWDDFDVLITAGKYNFIGIKKLMGWVVDASVVEKYIMKDHGKNILCQEDSHLHENLR